MVQLASFFDKTNTPMNNSRIVKWGDVKHTVLALNPMIGNSVDALEGSDDFELIEASYEFGEDIVKYGELFLPYKGKTYHYKSKELPAVYADLLNYYWLAAPFGMVLENSMESHILLETHLSPVRLLEPGGIFSLLTIFEDSNTDPYFLYQAVCMTAGCRSLVTLPKISHQQYNERLVQKFKMNPRSLCPKTLAQQWPFFYDLSCSEHFPKQWTTKLLFFSRHVVELLDKQLALKCSLMEVLWKRTAFLRNENTYNLLWSMFISKYVPLCVRNTPNVIETAKYCLKVALQQTPAFTPSTNDLPGPITEFTKALLEVYKIRYYYPVFMHLTFYDEKQPVYHTLQKPSFLNSIPQKSNANQTVVEMEHIHNIFRDFQDYLFSSDKLPFSVEHTKIGSAMRDTEFKCYHPMGKGDISSDIEEIYQQDPRFRELISSLSINPNLSFPINSIFFNGCIVIQPSKK